MLITGTDFIDGAVNFDTCHYVERERYEQDKHIQIRNGSILITKDGTLGKVAYIQGLTMPATLNAGVFNVEIKDENEVDNRYLFQYLKAPFLMDYVDKKATGGTIKHLNQNILVDFPVVLPHKAEQEKIGEYFLAIDHLITLHQREFAFLCKEKSKKFRYIKNAWEQRKVSDITNSYSGGTPKSGTSEYYDGNIPFIRSGEIYSDKTELFISELGMNYSSAKRVHIGDILYALYGATSGEVSRAKLDGAINQAILAIIPNQDINADFLVEWFRKEKDKIINTYLQGGQGNLSAQIIKELVVMIPSKEEQYKLGNYFTYINRLITLHQRKPNFYTGGYYAE